MFLSESLKTLTVLKNITFRSRFFFFLGYIFSVFNDEMREMGYSCLMKGTSSRLSDNF